MLARSIECRITLCRARFESRESDRAEWAFGSGRQGVTFVSRLNASTFLELARSYYSTPGRMDVTPGHEARRPASAEEALGQRFRAQPPGFSIGRCFECHATGPVAITNDAVVLAERGVRCEACHGPAKGHAANPALKNTVRGRKKLDGDKRNALCGVCHRSPGGDHANDFSNPWNVRHQPPCLEQSKCFQASLGQLTCATCHDSHAGLAASSALAAYDARCSASHDHIAILRAGVRYLSHAGGAGRGAFEVSQS